MKRSSVCLSARFTRVIALAALVALVTSAVAMAQGATRTDAPIGRFAVDIQGSVAPFGQNSELAISRGLDPSTQPGLGIGLSVGGHVYVFRLGFMTIGVGANVHRSVGNKRPGPESPNPDGPPLRQRFTALAPQLSLNFGGGDGWSYLSAGPGSSRLSLFERDSPEPPQRRTNTFNYGGGARWFTSRHLAFSLDLRFYNASPIPATATEPGSPRMTIMVLNIGASFK